MFDDEITALSIWPQSGKADLSQLHLSLLTDNDKDVNDNGTESISECPNGLYWCQA